MTVVKSVVVGLALANIAYYLWVHGIGQSQALHGPAQPTATLKLASEGPPAAVGEVDEEAAAVPLSAGHCVSVGPFKDVAEASHAASTLRRGGYDPRQRVVDGDRKRTASLYWIDIDLKAADGPLNPSDLQSEAGHINRLEIKACPAAAS